MGTSRNLERRTILKAAGASAAARARRDDRVRGRKRFRGRDGDDPLLVVGCRGAGQEDQPDHRPLLGEVPEDQGQDRLPDVRVLWEKFQTQAAGGNPPDVFQNAVTFLRKYDKRGILLDFKSTVQAGNLTLNHFRDGVTKVGDVDGKQLGIPVGSNTMALVVDKKVFQKGRRRAAPGMDLGRLLQGPEDHDRTKVPGDTGYFTIMYLYDLYLRQNGKAFYTKD
ncbi:ABC transporter substrate-binding protein [Streptomyces puniciscabiei]|uniref:ABC transporter substrate-binding protein n=1 Tax=Streptomyces puniciscabiei TaxID=164348 RepID=UPI00331DCCF9